MNLTPYVVYRSSLVADDGLGHLAEHRLLHQQDGGEVVQRRGRGHLLLLLLQSQGGQVQVRTQIKD